MGGMMAPAYLILGVAAILALGALAIGGIVIVTWIGNALGLGA